MIGYQKPVVHSGNKQNVLYEDQYIDSASLKKNVIVMGDIVEDSHMASKSNHDTILAIGFLNKQYDHIEADDVILKNFMKNFDLVITDDGSLCPVIEIIKSISGGKD